MSSASLSRPSWRMPRPLAAAGIALLGAHLVACGGGGDGGTTNPNPQPVITIVRATPSGDAQTGAAGAALADPLRVLVRSDNAPLQGATVTWSTASGGSLAPSSTTTDAQGIATSIWTLGPASGAQQAQAASTGAQGSPVGFAATATGGAPAPQVIQVQNNLFAPSAVTVTAGTTVEWRWSPGAVGHSVTPAPPPGFSGEPALHSAPFSHTFTFTQAGTYVYYCSAHGSPTGGMRGTITVTP